MSDDEILLIEQQVSDVIKNICHNLNIDENITIDSYPGEFISSVVLISMAIPVVEAVTGIEIPPECYIFYDKESRKQLSIKNAVEKLIKVSKKQTQHV